MVLSHTLRPFLFYNDDIRINATLTQLNSICNEIKRQSLNEKTKALSERVHGVMEGSAGTPIGPE